jgi:hypothetical protein
MNGTRILATIIDWEYPARRLIPPLAIYDLEDDDELMRLVLSFGNGTILEMRAIGETADAVEVLRGLAIGTGGCRPRPLTADERASLWLADDVSETYVRDGARPTFVLLHPEPQPALFPQ